MIDSVKKLGVRGLNHVISSESWAQHRLLRHAGAHLLVEAGALNIRLAIDERGLFHLASVDSQPDVTLSCPPDIVLRALFEQDKLFSSVKLGGSVDVAESLAFVFRNLKWDAEADLARLIGDIPAHRLKIIGQSLGRSLRSSWQNALENLREYVVEESAALPSPVDIAQFGEAVNRLRDDVARLEKRLSRL